MEQMHTIRAKVRRRGWYRRGANAYLDKRVLGIRLPVENLGPVGDREADLIVAKRVSDALRQKHFPEQQYRFLTVGGLLSTYERECLGHLASYKTAKYHVERLNGELGKELATAVNWPQLLEYAGKRVGGQGVGTRTVEAELDVLASAYHWSADYHGLPCSPFPRRWKQKLYDRYPYEPQPKLVLDGGEERGAQWLKILNNADAPVRLPLLLAYESGMRAREIVGCRTEWLYDGAVNLPGSATKSGNPRTVLLSADLYSDLVECAGGVYVFAQSDGRPYSYSWLRSGLRRAAKKAEIMLPRWSGLHTLRRTRATIDGSKGDIQAAMDKLGHADFATFARYSKVTDYRRKQAHCAH